MTFVETIGSTLAHTIVMTHFAQRHCHNYFLTTTSIKKKKRLKAEIIQTGEKCTGRKLKNHKHGNSSFIHVFREWGVPQKQSNLPSVHDAAFLKNFACYWENS